MKAITIYRHDLVDELSNPEAMRKYLEKNGIPTFSNSHQKYSWTLSLRHVFEDRPVQKFLLLEINDDVLLVYYQKAKKNENLTDNEEGILVDRYYEQGASEKTKAKTKEYFEKIVELFSK